MSVSPLDIVPHVSEALFKIIFLCVSFLIFPIALYTDSMNSFPAMSHLLLICYELNVCIHPPPNSYVETLIPQYNQCNCIDI